MDIINENVEHPQKVEVVNNLNANVISTSDNPLLVRLSPDVIIGSGASTSLKVFAQNSGSWVNIRPAGSNVTLHISSVHVVNSGVGYIFPVNLDVFNITSSASSSNVSAVYTSYSRRFPTATSITIFYEVFNSSGTVTAESYNSTDTD